MNQPYIDQSKNEKGEKEFSIHKLSENQFKMIQFVLNDSIENRDKSCNKKINTFMSTFLSKDQLSELEVAFCGVEIILDHDIK